MGIPNSDSAITKFPGDADPAAYYATGSSGNPTADPASDSADLMTGVVISVPGQSSQVTPDTAVVHLGDTAAASFGPVPVGGDPLTGISAADLTSTGAGSGDVVGNSYPGDRP